MSKLIKSKKQILPDSVFPQIDFTEEDHLSTFADALEFNPEGELLFQILKNHVKDFHSPKPKYSKNINPASISVGKLYIGGYKFPECWNVIALNEVNFMIVTLIDGLLLEMYRTVSGVEKRKKAFQIFGSFEISPFFKTFGFTNYLKLENQYSVFLDCLYQPDIKEWKLNGLTNLLNAIRLAYWPEDIIRKYRGFLYDENNDFLNNDVAQTSGSASVRKVTPAAIAGSTETSKKLAAENSKGIVPQIGSSDKSLKVNSSAKTITQKKRNIIGNK